MGTTSYTWMFEGIAGFTALLTVLLIVRLLTGRFVLTRKGSVVVAALGMLVFVGSALVSGSATSNRGSIGVVLWDEWVWVAPNVLPLVSGLMGWVALRSRWRWCFLVAGLGLLFLPWAVLLLRYCVGGAGGS